MTSKDGIEAVIKGARNKIDDEKKQNKSKHVKEEEEMESDSESDQGSESSSSSESDDEGQQQENQQENKSTQSTTPTSSKKNKKEKKSKNKKVKMTTVNPKKVQEGYNEKWPETIQFVERDEFLLGMFYELASFSIYTRSVSSHKLAQYVRHVQSLWVKDSQSKTQPLCPQARYAVKRLIKGLQSSRDAARQGFSAALEQV